MTSTNSTVRFDHEFDGAGVDESLPLIYMWEMWAADGRLVGRYVGKASKGARRPLSHYRRNVTNILANRPYRKARPDAFRRVLRALAEAVAQGHRIRLSLLTNVGPHQDINEREQALIKQHDAVGIEPWQLNG